MASKPDTPEMSVVVTIVDGGEILGRCLAALSEQTGPQTLEILIPFDHMSLDAKGFAEQYPAFTFVDLGRLMDGKIPQNALELHHFFDARRSGALRIAKSPLIAIIEDRGPPRPDWAATMIELHKGETHAAIGGAVENGVDRLWNWAIFFCDFGRYQPPLADDDPEYVTDTNICYRKDALMSVQHLWNDFYHESQVNWALRRNGGKLMLSDRPLTVQHRPPISMANLARERLHWGRMFGQIRGAEISSAKRLLYCLTAPLLPFLLFVRHFRRQQNKGHHLRQFALASPAIIFLLVFWSLGELIGYIEAKSNIQPAKP